MIILSLLYQPVTTITLKFGKAKSHSKQCFTILNPDGHFSVEKA